MNINTKRDYLQLHLYLPCSIENIFSHDEELILLELLQPFCLSKPMITGHKQSQILNRDVVTLRRKTQHIFFLKGKIVFLLRGRNY